eukprot:4532667-Amphidinium_carterae.1
MLLVAWPVEIKLRGVMMNDAIPMAKTVESSEPSAVMPKSSTVLVNGRRGPKLSKCCNVSKAQAEPETKLP